MIESKRLIGNIKEILGIRKKNGYAKQWKSELNTYDKPGKATHQMLEDIKKIAARLPLPRKGKSYISRTEKRKKYGLLLVKTLVAGTFAGLLIVGAKKPVINFASSLDFFKIKEIAIYGCQVTTPQIVKQAGGFDYNTSLFSLKPDKATANLVDHPWIKSIHIKRIWPDGISVEVKEHSVTALLVTGIPGQEKMLYLNSKGEIIAPVKAGEEIDYPVITGLHILAPHDKDAAVADAAEFLKLIAQNNPNLPAQSVSEVHFDMVEGMVIRLVDFPFPIYFGRGEVKKKYKQLRSVLAVLYKKQKMNIDMSQVEYIRMDYLNNKVLVAQSQSG